MSKFQDVRTWRKFASIHASVRKHFNLNLRNFRIKRLEFLTKGPIFYCHKPTHTNLD